LRQRDFDKLLLEAVDEGLTSLGESSKQAIYFYLEKSFNVKKQEIPYKINDFAYAIEKIFGLGGNFLEILIMRRLYERVGRDFEWRGSKDLTFTSYVAAAKRSFLKRKRAEDLDQCEQTQTESQTMRSRRVRSNTFTQRRADRNER